MRDHTKQEANGPRLALSSRRTRQVRLDDSEKSLRRTDIRQRSSLLIIWRIREEKTMIAKLPILLTLVHCVSAWIPTPKWCRLPSTSLDAAVGIFFGTSTGNTQTCAEKIAEALGPDASEPIDVDTLENGQLAQAFSEHGALVVGTPTWNTGADTQRSGTGWDELYYDKLPELSNVLAGKKVAVFGLGDQVSYAENYADATGELYDVFSSLGCDMIDGSWSQEGYEHEASKSIRGDKFCGLLLDMVNQEELTDERIEQWVAQLKQNGILEGGGGGGGAAAAAAPVQVETAPPVTTASEETPVQVVAPPSLSAEERLAQLERENAELRELLAQSYQASSVGSSAVSTSSVGFTPHYNPVTNKTMWTSSDGRSSYVTVGAPPQMKLRP